MESILRRMRIAGAAMRLLVRAMALEGQQPGRVFGFFLLYLLMFAVLGLADGLSLSLFVKRVGSDALPMLYGAVAVGNLAAIGAYVVLSERMGRMALMVLLLLMSGLGFGALFAILLADPSTLAYGLLFCLRELSYTLLLMHFGTFLQDFFSREQLVGALPVVYAGGRLGGLLGAGTLAVWSSFLPLDGLLAVCAALLLAAALFAILLRRRFSHVQRPDDDRADDSLRGTGTADPQELDRRARGGLGDFLVFLWRSPLMFWNTIAALAYVGCRFVLNYQYNSWFDEHFESEAAMAAFLGTYSAIALTGAILLQLFVVSRLVRALGLKGATLLYAALLGGALTLNVFGMTMTQAILSRLMENELRFGLRNPLNQLVINKFSKAVRVRVRAWSLGLLIPIGTIGTSIALGLVAQSPQALGALGGALGGSYLISTIRLNESYTEKLGSWLRWAKPGGRRSP